MRTHVNPQFFNEFILHTEMYPGVFPSERIVKVCVYIVRVCLYSPVLLDHLLTKPPKLPGVGTYFTL
jgi:hypothetical protein